MPTTFSIHGYVLEAMLHFAAVPRGVATASVLSDVLVGLTRDSLRLVATNSQVVGILHLSAMNAYGVEIQCREPCGIVIPVQELKPITRDKRYPHLQLTIDGFTITAKNSAGVIAKVLGRAPDEFPAYRPLIPEGLSAPINGLSVDAVQLERVVSFAKALRQEAHLMLGFHGDGYPFTVRIKNISAFYGMLVPAKLDQPVAAPPWWAQQIESSLGTESLADKEDVRNPSILSVISSLLPIDAPSSSPKHETVGMPAGNILHCTSARSVTPEMAPPKQVQSTSLADTRISQPEDLAIGQVVIYQGQPYPVLKVDGDWVDLDTSMAGKSLGARFAVHSS